MNLLNQLRKEYSYDPITGIFTRIKSRCKNWVGVRAGSIHSGRYRHFAVNKIDYLEHRLAWLYVHGRWPNEDIDHINGNGQDNRLCNLREATHTENLRNMKRRYNSCGHKGIYFHRQKKKWAARIRIDWKVIRLGYFESPKDAHMAYCRAATKFFGQFANFECSHEPRVRP